MTNNNDSPEKAPRFFPRSWVFIGAGVLICAAAFFMLRKWKAPVAEENQFYKVRRGDMLISVVEGGALKAVKESIIRSEFEGISRIISIVPEGTYVKEGQVLVELDSSELKDRVNQQEVTYQNNDFAFIQARSEEHTSELQSQSNLVCRLLLEKKKKNKKT